MQVDKHEDILSRTMVSTAIIYDLNLSQTHDAIYKRKLRGHKPRYSVSLYDYISMAQVVDVQESEAIKLWRSHFGEKEKVRI